MVCSYAVIAALVVISGAVLCTIVIQNIRHPRLGTTAIYLDATGDEERTFAKRLWDEG